MLNKPTNVSPYNEFIDINNGLELNFTLNNVVDGACIEIYDEENAPVFSDLIINTKKKRDFTYIIPDTSLLNNGKNYYWKVRYWNEPQETNDDFLCANYWDSKRQLVGLLPNKFYHYNDEKYHEAVQFESTKIKSIEAYSSSYMRMYISSGIGSEDMYDSDCFLCFPDIGLYMNIYHYENNGSDVPPEWYLSFDYDSIFYKGECLGDIYSNSEVVELLTSLLINGVSDGVIIKRFSNDDFLDEKKYIKLSHNKSSIVYKITSIDGDLSVPNLGVPSVGVFVNSFCFPVSEDGVIYCENVSTYSKCEYNESAPYYFSCTENPSAFMTFNAISTCSPQIELSSNMEKYIDINSYRYQLYNLSDTNSWDLLWESEKMNSIVSYVNTISTESVIYRGVTPQNSYKAKLVGQTADGVDFEIEKVFLSTNYTPTEIKDFISFNREMGCIEIDNSIFRANNGTTELQTYKYDVLKKELIFVSTTSYDINTTTESDGLCKRTTTYDFNVISDAEYIYYAFIMDNGNVVSSYASAPITPSWNGVYLNDVIYRNSITYDPDPSKVWFLDLNFESGEITRNYQVSHPLGIGQKYPKSVRGNANYKTGQISGLLGSISCISGDYNEDVYLIENFDDFCSDGKPKLLRSSIKGEHLIADIDKMNSSEFGHIASSINISYTQIDDIIRKQISVEV